MAELKRRASMHLGFVLQMQDIDPDTDVIVREHHVNTWGTVYNRLEVEEAVLFQKRLQETCGADLLKIIEKAMEVAADFGIETIIGTDDPNVPKIPPGQANR